MAADPVDRIPTTEGTIPVVAGHLCEEHPETDRRDSPRIPVTLWVRQLETGGSFEERTGNLAVGGVYFLDRFPPAGRLLQIRFRLPKQPKELRVRGEIVRVCEQPDGYGVHVRFLALPTEVELEIARYLDDLLMPAPRP